MVNKEEEKKIILEDIQPQQHIQEEKKELPIEITSSEITPAQQFIQSVFSREHKNEDDATASHLLQVAEKNAPDLAQIKELVKKRKVKNKVGPNRLDVQNPNFIIPHNQQEKVKPKIALKIKYPLKIAHKRLQPQQNHFFASDVKCHKCRCQFEKEQEREKLKYYQYKIRSIRKNKGNSNINRSLCCDNLVENNNNATYISKTVGRQKLKIQKIPNDRYEKGLVSPGLREFEEIQSGRGDNHQNERIQLDLQNTRPKNASSPFKLPPVTNDSNANENPPVSREYKMGSRRLSHNTSIYGPMHQSSLSHAPSNCTTIQANNINRMNEKGYYNSPIREYFRNVPHPGIPKSRENGSRSGQQANIYSSIQPNISEEFHTINSKNIPSTKRTIVYNNEQKNNNLNGTNKLDTTIGNSIDYNISTIPQEHNMLINKVEGAKKDWANSVLFWNVKSGIISFNNEKESNVFYDFEIETIAGSLRSSKIIKIEDILPFHTKARYTMQQLTTELLIGHLFYDIDAQFREVIF